MEGELEPVPSGRDPLGTRDGTLSRRDQPETTWNRVETQDPEDSVSAVGRIKAGLQLDSLPSDSGHWKVGRTSSRRESMIIDTPIRRSHRAFVRSGLRQSMGKMDLISSQLSEEVDEDDLDSQDLRSDDGDLVIDGRTLQLAQVGKPEFNFAPVRLWDKEARHALPGDVKQTFVRAATALVLSKTNKLAAPRVVTADNKYLARVLNLQSQLKTLRAHLITYDIFDVMTIVVPVDVREKVDVERKQYNLFDDYPQLHAIHVANSCTWYNRWVTNSYISENMALTYTFFQNNTEDELWSKCLELYEEYTPIQQGGPLMAFLLLQRIQDSSEQALELLRNQVKALNISKLPGEDVEQAVSLVKSTYRVLQSSSTQTRSYLPTDFAKTVFRVFQTSTVFEFNEVFHSQALDIQTQADLYGTQPRWPSVMSVVKLATNTYRRLKQSGIWDGAVKRPPGAFTGKSTSSRALTSTPAGPPRGPHASAPPASQRTPKCWNCGGDHLLDKCTRPRDQSRIDQARQRYFAWRRTRGSPRHKTGSDGKPLILNKNGFYVLDQRRWREQHPTNTSNEASPGGTSPPSPSQSGPSAHVAARAAAVRTALRRTTPAGS